ncbi:MAG: Ig-like domain-containing protein [Bdellovibrio sp.]
MTATPAAPSPFTSTLVANPNSAVPADGSTAANLTITIKDIYGNAIPNATVNISATGTGNTLNLSSSTTNSLGKVTGTLKSTVAENKTLSFISPAELSGISTVVGFGATVTPDATMSGIIGSATTVADGVSTATITINLQSAAGQPAAGYVPTFSATDTNNTNTYGTCSMSDVNGNSTCTLKSTKAESKILTLLTPVNKTGVAVTFIAGATDHLTFTQQPVSANINTALNPQPIVEIQDAYSNRITSGTDSTASITLNLFSGTGNLLGTVAMNAVNGVADFNGKGIAFDRSGTKVLKATSGSFTKNSSPFSITSFPTLLSWSGANNFARGSCSSLTVSAYDANSDLTVLNSAMPVTLGGAGGTFYSDSSCLSPIVNTQIAMGTSGQIIYYKNNTSGNYTLTADASNLPQASYNVTLVIPPPTKLVWSGPTFGKNGACSGALTITSQDGTNQSANVTDNTVVTLGGQGSGSFYSDAGCGSSISQATINAGSSSTVVYFKDTVGETLTFTADATGLTQGSYAYQGQYPVLYLSGTGGSTIDGVAITSCGGTDVCNSTNPYVISTDAKFYSVTMVNGAYAAGQAWTSGTPNAGNGILSISVQSNFNLCLTCNINVDGKGYTAGNGPGAGSGVSGTGGSYGGLGGVGASAVASAASYGSVTAPTDLGSGGSVNGGKGGGSIRLNVAGTLTLNGTITSNGTAGATYCCWGSASGGSGGSIQITTGTLAGSTGILHADGGAGGDGNAGGGSGGRIAINYGTDSYSGGAIAIGKSGFGGGSSRSGGAGTIFLLHNGVETYGSLVVDNNGHVGEVTPLMASSNFDNLIVKNKGNLQIPGAMSLQSTTVNFNDGVITNNGSYLNAVNTITGINLVNGGTLNIPGGNLIIGAGGTLTLATGAPLALTNLTIQSGGSVTHAANSTAKTYFVDISVSNKLQIDFGGSINADGKGYTAQNGPGAGSGSNGTGGSYGGLGGIGTSGVAAASGYGSVTAPTHLGSGGSVNGGTGGGSIRLNIGDTLVLNGTISSNGTAGVAYCCYASSAGGSGGSIQITTATLTGSTGTLHVNGGAGGDPNYGNGGGGGGGRIAVNYTTDSYTGSIDALTMSSYGGGASIPGGAGTIFLMHTGVDTNGRLIIDNNNQTGYTTPLLASSNFDSVTIKNKGNLEIPAGLTLQSTTANFNSGLLTNKGSYLNAINTIFGWNLINSGTLNIPGGNLTIGSGGTLTFANGAPLALTNLTIQNSGLITHLANSNAKTYFVDISVSNKLQIDLGGSINADGKGYTAQNGPGAGSGSNGTGGSYGGLGGVGTSGVAAASSYGSVTAPTDLGSGGSANGGTGGGAIRLNVGDTLVLNGTISSNGTAGVAYCCYASSAGGSGGSIKITTGTLTGSTGALHVDGGNGGDPNYGYGGSGGGGRLAINYTTDSYTGNIDGLLMSAYGGSKNFPGGAGTIFLMHTGVDTNGRLIIDNNNQIAAATPLLDNYNFDFVILRNRGSLATNAGQSLTQDQIVGSTGGTLTNNGSITLSTLSGVNIINNGTLNFPSGNLTIASGGTLTTVGSAPLTVGNLTILSGGTLTHFTNTTVKTNWLNLNVTGNLQIDLGGSIDVSGKGFAAQSGPGAGGAGNGAAGGCYGGIGGLGYSSSTKGVSYGSIINPVDLGSAGGNFNGGGYNGLAGGGAALITVGGTLTVNGTILANGVGSTSSANYDARRGSGSGGSINITTNAIAGTTGMLQAKGGSSIAGQWNSGGGGGGRIALIYSSDAYSGGINGLSISASGGTSCGQGSCTDAGAGSIFIKDTVGNPNGLVLIDNFSINGENSVINEDLTLNSLTLSNKGHTEFKTGKTLNLNSFTINNSQLTNYGTVNATGWSFTNGASYINIGTFTPSLSTISDFSFENYGTISIPTNALTIGNNGTFIVGTNSLVLNNLTISSGGTLTHSKNLGTSKDYVLNLTINNNLTVDSGGKIDVSAKGFRYQQGSGAGGTGNGAAGGCYGGVGGLGYTSSTACTSFGSSTNPTDLGGSGGNFDSGTLGRAGGGAAIITVAGTFTLNGSVIANGEAPASSADSWQRAGSGSGGSININANILAGSGGTLSAKGGSAFTAAWGSGGGGGGRIALACTTDSYTNGKATIITNVSGGTGCGYGSCTSGGAGTVYESP